VLTLYQAYRGHRADTQPADADSDDTGEESGSQDSSQDCKTSRFIGRVLATETIADGFRNTAIGPTAPSFFINADSNKAIGTSGTTVVGSNSVDVDSCRPK